MALRSSFKTYLGAPCHTSKFCQLFLHEPLLGDLTATGKIGHSIGGAFGSKKGRHGTKHNAATAVSIVRRFSRVHGAVRTSTSSSSNNNPEVSIKGRILPVKWHVHGRLALAHQSAYKHCGGTGATQQAG